MDLYTVRIVGRVPLASGRYPLTEYVVAAIGEAQAEIDARQRHMLSFKDAQIRCIAVEPATPDVMLRGEREIDVDELARIEASPGVYRVTQES